MRTEHGFTPWAGKQEKRIVFAEQKQPLSIQAKKFMSQARNIDPKDPLVSLVRGLIKHKGSKANVTDSDCEDLSKSPHVERVFGYAEPAGVYALVQLVDSIH